MRTKKILLCMILILTLVMSGTAMVYASTDSLVAGNNLIVAETTGSGVETPAPEEEEPDPSITIQNIPASMQVGETATLSYTIKNSDEDDVTWSSNNPDILSVDSGGKLTANAEGTAKITAKAGKAKDTVKITVKAVELEGIKIVSKDFGMTASVTGYEMKVGETALFEIEADPKEAAPPEVTWEVSDPKIAEIDEGGTLIALDSGEVVVRASTSDGLEDEIKLTVGTTIPWVMIAIIAVVVIIIIVLVVLVIRKKKNDKKSGKKYDDDDEYEDDEDEDDDDDDEDDAKSKAQKEKEELERLRQEAYRKGYADRENEMTKMFNPKDFDFDDDDKE